MPKITAIQAQVRRSGRCSIFVEGEFFCGVDQEVVRRLNLQLGQEIDLAALQHIVEQAEEIRAQELCLRWLERRPHSRQELAERLRQRGIEIKVAESVLKRLADVGLINDEDFARSWLGSQTAGKSKGRYRLRIELLHRGVSPEIIERVLTQELTQDESSTCVALAQSRLRFYSGLPSVAVRRRLTGFLSRRGFSPESIQQALTIVLPNVAESSAEED